MKARFFRQGWPEGIESTPDGKTVKGSILSSDYPKSKNPKRGFWFWVANRKSWKSFFAENL